MDRHLAAARDSTQDISICRHLAEAAKELEFIHERVNYQLDMGPDLSRSPVFSIELGLMIAAALSYQLAAHYFNPKTSVDWARRYVEFISLVSVIEIIGGSLGCRVC